MEVRADREEAPWPLAEPEVVPAVVLPPLLPARVAVVEAGPLAAWASVTAVPMHMPAGEGNGAGMAVSCGRHE